MSADRLELRHQIKDGPHGRKIFVVGTTAGGIHTTERPPFPPAKTFLLTPNMCVGVLEKVKRLLPVTPEHKN